MYYKYLKFYACFNFISDKARKESGKKGGQPAAAAQIAPAEPVIAPAAALQNGPFDLGAQLGELAGDGNIAVDVNKKEDPESSHGRIN